MFGLCFQSCEGAVGTKLSIIRGHGWAAGGCIDSTQNEDTRIEYLIQDSSKKCHEIMEVATTRSDKNVNTQLLCH
jgi:hypothetical protein